MGLQVRVKHALGSRLIELPDRTIDNPITVGRAAGVEVQVPSVSVAARHCVLFRYEGRWAVQDVQAASGPGTTGTFVNGQQVVDPVMLQIGDVISVGSEASAPTIEVDPAAAAEGRSGWAGDEMTAAPMVPGYAAPAGYAAPQGYAAAPGYVSTTGGGGYNRAAPRQPAAAPAAWGGNGAQDNGDHIDMSSAVASTPAYTPSYQRRKKQQLSPVAIIIGTAVSLAILAFAGWWIISHQQSPPVVVVAPKPKAVEDSGHANNIFGIGGNSTPDHSTDVVRPPPAVTPRPATPPSTDTPDGGSKPGPTPPNPGNKPTPPPAKELPPGSDDVTPAKTPPTAAPKPALLTDEWQEMQDLHNSSAEPALAIFRLNDYQKHHAGQHADELAKYMDDKFDRLWWDRIEQLFKKIDRLKGDAHKKLDESFDETDKDVKKKDLEEKEHLEATQKLTKAILTDKMGYKEEQPPPAGAAELDALRQKRDAAKYAEWKRTTLNSIINNHGTTDWVADN